MELNILDPANVKQIITEIESQENRDRRRYEWQQYLCMEGELHIFVKGLLEKMLPQDSKWMEPVDVRISKKIVDKLGKAYSLPPKRYIQDERTGEKNEKKTDLLNEIYEKGMFNNALMHFDKNVNLHKYACLWITEREGEYIKAETVPVSACHPVFDPDTGKLLAMVLNYPGEDITHDHYSVDRGSDKLGRGMSFTGPDGVNQMIAESPHDSNTSGNTYAMWTPKQHAVYKVSKETSPDGKTVTNITYVRQTDNEKLNGVNDLGVIPFVFYSTDQNNELPIRNPITRQTIFINALLSALAAAAIRNIGVAKLKRPQGMEVNILEQGLSTFVDLAQPKNAEDGQVDLTFEVPNHDLQGQLTVALSLMMQIFSEYGIKATDAISGQTVQEFASGLDRALAQADVTDLIEMRQMIYEQQVEPQIFKIVQAYLKRKGQDQFGDKSSVSVIYQKPRILKSDEQTLNNLDKQKTMRLISRTGQMKVLDPNLTTKEAKKMLEMIDEENMEDSARNMASFMSNQQNSSDEEDNEEESEERELSENEESEDESSSGGDVELS